jgi:hypothetical protein
VIIALVPAARFWILLRAFPGSNRK